MSDLSLSAVPILTLVVGAIAWMSATRLYVFRMLSPFSLSLLLLVSIYGVRPLLILSAGESGFYSLNTSDGFAVASFVGLAAVASFCLGYWLRTGGSLEPEGTVHVRSPGLLAVFAISVAATLAWFAAFSAIGGGWSAIAVLFSGRSAQASELTAGIPNLLFALPVGAGICLSFARIQAEKVRQLRRSELLVFWIGVLVTCVPATSLGGRRFLIPILLSAVLAASASRPARRARAYVAASLAVVVVALMAIPFTRSQGSRSSRADLFGSVLEYVSTEGPLGVVERFALDYDTEMFDYVAYVAPRLGSSIPYGLGRGTVGDALLNPFPTDLLPFTPWSEQLLVNLFGGGCGQPFCPVASMPGALFFDFGFVGVVVGMILAGIAARVISGRLLHAHGIGLLALLATASFFPLMVRGNPANQAWILINVIAVGAAFVLFASRTRDRPAGSKPPRHVRGTVRPAPTRQEELRARRTFRIPSP